MDGTNQIVIGYGTTGKGNNTEQLVMVILQTGHQRMMVKLTLVAVLWSLKTSILMVYQAHATIAVLFVGFLRKKATRA